MNLAIFRAVFLAFATMAVAQCPVSGDASTCTTPTPQSNQPATQPKSATTQSKAATTGKGAAEPASAAPEETITRTQADAILIELKEIRALLQKQQPATPGIDFSKVDFEATPVVKLAPNNHWDNMMGKQDAPVVLVEFSDYQCPHCAKVHTEMFDVIKKKYIDTGKVQFVSRDLALAFHPWAIIAAEASHCAGDQDKYWQMRDWLMQHSATLSPAVIEQGARTLALNMTTYHACVESRRYYTSVKEDADAALAAQVFATPAFIVGKNQPESEEGKRKLGVGSVTELEALIDEALGAKK